MIQLLPVSHSGFYSYLKRPAKNPEDRKLLDQIYECLREFDYNSWCYGYRRIYKWLVIRKKYNGSYHKIHRTCQENNIKIRKKSKRGPKRSKSRGRTKESAPDLVNRKFKSVKPNELWLTDITEIKTREGKLYLCSLRDCFDGSICGYCIDDNETASLCVRALENACNADNVRGMIVHSDNGTQFKSQEFKAELKKVDACQSMGAVGTCADNARMESWHGTFKTELIDPIQAEMLSKDQVKTEIFRYIVYYNCDRITLFNNGWPPLAFRDMYFNKMIETVEKGINL